MTPKTAPRARDLWFTLHQWVGLGSGLFLLIAAATGAVLAYRPQLDALLNPGLFRAPGHAGASLLTPNALAQGFERQVPAARVSLLPLSLRGGEAVAISVVPRAGGPKLGYDQVFLDPVDGRILGQRSSQGGWDSAHILQGLYDLHVRLLAGTVGRWLMGAVSGLWALSSLIGVYLTLPRAGPFWARWKPVWGVAWRARLPRLMLDLHRASGLWLIAAAVAVGFTGCAMNFFGEATAPVLNRLSPSRVAALNDDDTAAPTVRRLRRLGWDAAEVLAARSAAVRGAALKPAVAAFDPQENLYRVGFTRSGVRDYTGLGPVYWYVDAETGAIAYVDDPYRDSLGRKAIRGLYPVHSGQMLGGVGRLLIFVLGLATVEMCGTGVWLWWKRRAIRGSAQARALG